MHGRLLWLSMLVIALSLVAGEAVQAAAAGRVLELSSQLSNPAEVKLIGERFVLIYRERGAESRVAVTDRQGRELFMHAPASDVPDTRLCTILDATLTDEGVLVVSATFLSTAGQAATVLAEYDVAKRVLVRIVRTSPVSCVALAGDTASVWCLGHDGAKEKAKDTEYDVVQQYALSGELLRSMFGRGGFEGAPMERAGRTVSRLVAGGGHFAAWLPASDSLLLWGAVGVSPRRLTVAPRAAADSPIGDELVMQADGRVVGLLSVSADAAEPRHALSTLDESGTFVPLLLPDGGEIPAGWRLVGADGSDLVFFYGFKNTLYWVPTGRETSE